MSFRAEAKNLAEAKRHCINYKKHHSVPTRLPRRTSRIAMTNRGCALDCFAMINGSCALDCFAMTNKTVAITTTMSFRAQAKNLAEAKRHCINYKKHHSVPTRLPRRTSRIAMTNRGCALDCFAMINGSCALDCFAMTNKTVAITTTMSFRA